MAALDGVDVFAVALGKERVFDGADAGEAEFGLGDRAGEKTFALALGIELFANGDNHAVELGEVLGGEGRDLAVNAGSKRVEAGDALAFGSFRAASVFAPLLDEAFDIGDEARDGRGVVRLGGRR